MGPITRAMDRLNEKIASGEVKLNFPYEMSMGLHRPKHYPSMEDYIVSKIGRCQIYPKMFDGV